MLHEFILLLAYDNSFRGKTISENDRVSLEEMICTQFSSNAIDNERALSDDFDALDDCIN